MKSFLKFVLPLVVWFIVMFAGAMFGHFLFKATHKEEPKIEYSHPEPSYIESPSEQRNNPASRIE